MCRIRWVAAAPAPRVALESRRSDGRVDHATSPKQRRSTTRAARGTCDQAIFPTCVPHGPILTLFRPRGFALWSGFKAQMHEDAAKLACRRSPPQCPGRAGDHAGGRRGAVTCAGRVRWQRRRTRGSCPRARRPVDAWPARSPTSTRGPSTSKLAATRALRGLTVPAPELKRRARPARARPPSACSSSEDPRPTRRWAQMQNSAP